MLRLAQRTYKCVCICQTFDTADASLHAQKRKLVAEKMLDTFFQFIPNFHSSFRYDDADDDDDDDVAVCGPSDNTPTHTVHCNMDRKAHTHTRCKV